MCFGMKSEVSQFLCFVCRVDYYRRLNLSKEFRLVKVIYYLADLLALLAHCIVSNTSLLPDALCLNCIAFSEVSQNNDTLMY